MIGNIILHIVFMLMILPAWVNSYEERKISLNVFYTFGISINVTMIILYLNNRIVQ